MSCPISKFRLGPMPENLEDKSLIMYPNHTQFTHMGCVLIRVVMGLLLASNICQKTRTTIIFIMTMVLIAFAIKYLNVFSEDLTLWKFYPRMLVAYSSALYLLHQKKDGLAGIVIIADALIGFQSRYTTSLLSCGLKK